MSGDPLSAIGAEQRAQPYPSCRLAHQRAVPPQGQAPPPLNIRPANDRSPGSSDGPMPFLGQRRECADALVGEETALVRPYVLAIEERTRQPSTAGPHPLPADTWFTAAGAR